MFKILQILEFSIPTRQSINSFVLDFVLWSFVFVSCFGFRISDFPVFLSKQNVMAEFGKKLGKLLRRGFMCAFCSSHGTLARLPQSAPA